MDANQATSIADQSEEEEEMQVEQKMQEELESFKSGSAQDEEPEAIVSMDENAESDIEEAFKQKEMMEPNEAELELDQYEKTMYQHLHQTEAPKKLEIYNENEPDSDEEMHSEQEEPDVRPTTSAEQAIREEAIEVMEEDRAEEEFSPPASPEKEEKKTPE